MTVVHITIDTPAGPRSAAWVLVGDTWHGVPLTAHERRSYFQ